MAEFSLDIDKIENEVNDTIKENAIIAYSFCGKYNLRIEYLYIKSQSLKYEKIRRKNPKSAG